ncbi:MAG: LysE family translocator, partial [Burkholderiales bacterium]|nr:LysE family translocator [Burkholderiales bacterium]
AGLLLNLTPGPDVFFIIAHAARRGARAGVVAALGISAGCCVHVAAAAVGVSALVAASATAFGVLKLVGALYLVVIGARMLRAALRGERTAPGAGAVAAEVDLSTVFRRGFLTNVLNPKVALFFLAFVPQFIAPGSAHASAMFLALGLLFTFNSTLVNSGWALATAWAARRAGALQRGMRWLDGVAGTLFIGFGVRLALSDLPAAA